MPDTPSLAKIPTAVSTSPLILFMDKVILQPKPLQLRGVEIFNLALLQDCAKLDVPMIVAAHHTWKSTLDFFPTLHWVSADDAGWNGLTTIFSLRRQPFTALLLGNVANRLIPTLRLFQWLHPAARIILFAHRDPSRRFLRALPPRRTTVTPVNRIIADHFRQAGIDRIDEYYGVPCADQFYPAPASKRSVSSVNFCVLGSLDAAWKGADTALAAFRQLPPAARTRCRLHLASYDTPPLFSEPDIRTYPWMPADAIPDFLRQMDVVIVPSRDEDVMRETFSQAIVQGMLTGLPILAGDLPILAEKLDAGGGYVFHGVEELTDHMVQLAEHPELRQTLGAQARQTALTRYTWDTVVFARRHLFTSGQRP